MEKGRTKVIFNNKGKVISKAVIVKCDYGFSYQNNLIYNKLSLLLISCPK